MRGLFLSYDRRDRERAAELQRALEDAGIEVWRDQESLYAGERWPKTLGEVIAAKDAVLLLWSGHAAESDFVEMEWCTAVALKKPVLPCLTDETPLPAALSSVHGIPASDPAAAARWVAESLQTPRPTDAERTRRVLDGLGEIRTSRPREVLDAARRLFADQHLAVAGDVYQAGRDIVVVSTRDGVGSGAKWPLVLGLVAALLLVIGVATVVKKDLPGIVGEAIVDCYRKEHNCWIDVRVSGRSDQTVHFSRVRLELVEVEDRQRLGFVAVSQEYEIDLAALESAGDSVEGTISQDVGGSTDRFGLTAGVSEGAIPQGFFRTWRVRLHLIGPTKTLEIENVEPLMLPWNLEVSGVDPRAVDDY